MARITDDFNPGQSLIRDLRMIELEEAFNAARLTHPMTGMKYDSFEDYVKNDRNKTAAECVDDFNNPKKNWEIVSFKDNNDELWALRENGWYNTDWEINSHDGIWKLENALLPQHNCKIHSVRRISDGCVFTVGDLIGWGVPSGYQTIIVSFSIADSRLKIDYQPEGLNLLSVDFEKAVRLHKKVKQPKKLFTTEDVVEIYEGDKVWVVFSDFSFSEYDLKLLGNDMMFKLWETDINRRPFSTEAAAKEYVKMNKPNLSVRDVLQTLRAIFEKTGEYHPSHGTISLELQAVSKSKI